MNKLLIVLFTTLLLTLSICKADDDDRYRALVLQQAGGLDNHAKVFILDSEDGHMWTWEDKTKFATKDGKFSFGSLLTYQGKLKRGKSIGEIVGREAGK